MEAEMMWRRSLRSSEGDLLGRQGPGRGRPRDRSDQGVPLQKRRRHTRPLLHAVVGEDEVDDVGSKMSDADVPGLRERRKNGAKRSVPSLSDISNQPTRPSLAADAKGSEVPPSPRKEERPTPAEVADEVFEDDVAAGEVLDDPLPAPEDGTNLYESDFLRYLMHKEAHDPDMGASDPVRVVKGSESRGRSRSLLTDWLTEVLHYFRCCQETLYYAVNLLDAYMAAVKMETGQIQLLGVACVLVATKLEEYYPADVADLARLTENSWSPREILQMERTVLAVTGFRCYTVQPKPFVDRLIRLAKRESDELFRETCFFFLDSLIRKVHSWSIAASCKAAAAVYAALVLYDDAWDDRLREGSTYEERNIAWLAKTMLFNMSELLRMNDGNAESAHDCGGGFSGLRNKYMSNSRHHGLLRKADPTVVNERFRALAEKVVQNGWNTKSAMVFVRDKAQT